MRIVVDTNVLVSGLLNANGPPAQILGLIINKKMTVLYDNRILSEYYEVLKRKKFRFKKEWIDPLIDFIKIEEEYVIAEPLKIKLRDQDDKMFLEVAMSGNANYLITGNLIHFPKNKMIINPRGFIENYN